MNFALGYLYIQTWKSIPTRVLCNWWIPWCRGPCAGRDLKVTAGSPFLMGAVAWPWALADPPLGREEEAPSFPRWAACVCLKRTAFCQSLLGFYRDNKSRGTAHRREIKRTEAFL